MTSTPSHPTGEKSAHEAVIRRYQKQIDYYWARGKGNKRRYIAGRYLTIILGAAVTLLATLTSAEFIARSDTWDTILRIVTPLLAATLAVIGALSQSFQWGATWREMAMAATRLEGERDRILTTPATEFDPRKEVAILDSIVLGESKGYFDRILGRSDPAEPAPS
jgi:hypothetical protein